MVGNYYLVGESYDNGGEDDPDSPFLGVISIYTTVETILDGQVMIKGFVEDIFQELDDLLFGPVYFDEPIVYNDPQPRSGGANAVAAIFVEGLGGVYPPLSVGTHTMENTLESLYFDDIHTTYNITVVPRRK